MSDVFFSSSHRGCRDVNQATDATHVRDGLLIVQEVAARAAYSNVIIREIG
jgi:hypothetical protein